MILSNNKIWMKGFFSLAGGQVLSSFARHGGDYPHSKVGGEFAWVTLSKWPMTFSAQHRITRWALSPLGKRLNPQVECPIAGDRQDSFLSSHRTKAIKRPAQTASPLTPETTCKRFGEKGGRKQQPCLPLLLLQLLLPMCSRLGSAQQWFEK